MVIEDYPIELNKHQSFPGKMLAGSTDIDTTTDSVTAVNRIALLK
jgi:hypothetical protein